MEHLSSNKNDFFGSLFDLNGDGKTTIDEEYMAFQIMNQCTKNVKNNSKDRHTSSHHYISKSQPTVTPANLTEQKIYMPETLSKENYPQRKNVQKTSIVAAIITGLVLSLIPIVVIWAVITGDDENNSAYWFVALLFGGGAMCLLGIIWHSVVASISKCHEQLNLLNKNYRKLLSPEEIIIFEKKKRNKRIVNWSVIGIIVAVMIAISAYSVYK